MKTAFGLDIAGYSTGKSGFARADFVNENHIEVTVYQGHTFARKSKGGEQIENIVKKEKELLAACCRKGPVFVDIPIDLQGLPSPPDASYIWELIYRPVDFAFDAMPPLADRIGSPVARFLNLLSSIQREFKDPLGKQIFETYPARSLFYMGLRGKGYKKQKVCYSKMKWMSHNKNKILTEIVEGLDLTAGEDVCLDDNELDAGICAITGIADENHRLQENELTECINGLISNGKRYPAPMGYVLLKKKPDVKINITKKTMKSHEEMLEAVAG